MATIWKNVSETTIPLPSNTINHTFPFSTKKERKRKNKKKKKTTTTWQSYCSNLSNLVGQSCRSVIITFAILAGSSFGN